MLNFNNVRRGNTVTVTPILDADIKTIEHFMEKLNVTGWNIASAYQVRLHLGENYPLVTKLPVWKEMPDFTMTDQVSYFVSFYEKTDIQKKLDEILTSDENSVWQVQIATEAAKAQKYQEAFNADPGPFDIRRDLK